MRSDTITPMLQFINWWGISPWLYSGIDIENKYLNNFNDKDKCYCILQHDWQSKSNWSRDALIEMLKNGERTFILESGLYPAPTQILNEAHQYNGITGLTQKKTNKLKSVRINYPCNIKEFGVKYLESIGVEGLVRDSNGDGSGTILKEFVFTVQLPVGTKSEQVKTYFTIADGRTITVPNPQDDIVWEVRPLKVEIDTNYLATISGGAYLFKKPELDEYDTCLPHSFTTYVEEVEIFIENIDKCKQGYFVCESGNCSGHNCEKTRNGVCIFPRVIGNQKWAVPSLNTCDANGNFTSYCPTCVVSELELNYVTGKELDNRNLINAEYLDVISMLSISLYDCIREWCQCDICPSKKTDFYRSYELIKIVEGGQGMVGDQWKHFITNQTLMAIGGLPPYRGITMAFDKIRKISCTNLNSSLI